MPTSAAVQRPRPPSADRPPARRPRARTGPLPTGFTLLEVLVALTIIGLMAAVVVPGLARRLDVAFSNADAQQLESSAQLLPARVATLGIDLLLDNAALSRKLPDGGLPLDIPLGWTVKVEKAARLARSGTCEAGALLLSPPADAPPWRVRIDRLTCVVTLKPASETPA